MSLTKPHFAGSDRGWQAAGRSGKGNLSVSAGEMMKTTRRQKEKAMEATTRRPARLIRPSIMVPEIAPGLALESAAVRVSAMAGAGREPICLPLVCLLLFMFVAGAFLEAGHRRGQRSYCHHVASNPHPACVVSCGVYLGRVRRLAPAGATDELADLAVADLVSVFR